MTVSPAKIISIKKRADFLRAADSGRRWVAAGIIMQVGPLPQNLPPDAPPLLHYGLTATKKIGGAVIRNRARRRMRALAREVLLPHADPAFAYILVARPNTPTHDYALLRQELMAGLKRLKLWQD